MRLFLCYLLTNIIFRSMAVLVPWSDWADDLAVDRMPRSLPTRDEIANLDDPELIAEEMFRAADSVWDFLRPWPGPQTRLKLREALDWGRWSVAWTSSRFGFVESLVGFDQEWPMFSPNVSKKRWLTRVRLTYADGSEMIVRQRADPLDLTCYAHWFEEKILDHELHVRADGRTRSCKGYCNLLAHRHAVSAAGSSLVRISLYDVCIKYPAPGQDPVLILRAQSKESDLPPDQVGPVYFVYDVATRQGERISQR